VPPNRLVAEKLQELIDRLDQADDEVREKLVRSLPRPRVIAIEVSDLQTTYWTELEDGRMDGLHQGPSPDADIRVTARSDDLVAMVDGQKSLFSSYLSGHVRVDASLSDLLALRRLL
jgi:predicted lipid carrier protein YhbT